MKEFQVIEVSHNSDSMEGRGIKIVDGYFLSTSDAIQAATAVGDGWGHPAHTEPVKIRIFESYTEFDRERRATLREQALNKLSDAEKEELGLSR